MTTADYYFYNNNFVTMAEEISSTGDLLSNPSFRRWVYGTATKPEAGKWDEWCRKNDSNRRLVAKAQAELLGITLTFSEPDKSKEAWSDFFVHIKNTQKMRLHSHRRVHPIVWSYRAAAVFLVIAITSSLTYGIYQSNIEATADEIVWHEVKTTYGEQKTITLTDGSSIILAANSLIKYSGGWGQNSEVTVKLKGEAYFSIVPKQSLDRPFFKVKTSDGTVQVTGTRFFVDADEHRTCVVLEEGSVNIAREILQAGQGQAEDILLKPNQLVEFSRDVDSVHLKRVNPEIYTSWTRQVLVLDNTPVRFLADKIKKTYGVVVRMDDSGLNERRLTGSVNFRSLDRLLLAVSEVLEIEVTQSGDTVTFKSKG